jgi:hypothetical protein
MNSLLDYELQQLRRQGERRETNERFARLEALMTEIIHILNEHTRQLQRLNEAVREKIGFKAQQ